MPRQLTAGEMATARILSSNLSAASPAMRLVLNNMDPGVLRPWRGKDGNSYITRCMGTNDNGEPVYRNFLTNTPALLRREDWLKIDRKIQWQAKQRLRFWDDIYSANPFDIPNGMEVMSIQHAIANGEADAKIAMDPVDKSERTRPTLELVQIPVPVLFSDGEFSARELAVSRGSGMPLDTTNIELAGRKIGETLEKWSLGLVDSFAFANGTIYGATNFPYTLTGTMTDPESGGYDPKTTVNEILSIIQQLEQFFYYGPYNLYYSNKWGQFMDRDYSTQYAGETLRTRLAKVAKINSIKTLDFLPDFSILLVQMTRNVVEGVNGMDIQTVQWEENGGFTMMFKVLCINFPRFRFDSNRRTGVAYYTAGTPTTTTTTTTTSTTTTS